MPGKTYKVIVLGAKGTGKTALIQQAIYGNHIIGTSLPSTVEDIYEGNVLSDRGMPERFRFYDTAGLDCQKPGVPKHYFALADAYVLLFDITRWETFHCLNALKAEIDKNKEKKDSPVILVLGNKSDLEQEARQIESDIVQKWAQREKVKFMEVTVTNRKTITDSLVWLATKLTTVPPRSGFSLKLKKGPSAQAVLSLAGIPSDV